MPNLTSPPDLASPCQIRQRGLPNLASPCQIRQRGLPNLASPCQIRQRGLPNLAYPPVKIGSSVMPNLTSRLI